MNRNDTKENIIASFIDMTSIFVAYSIGMSQLGLAAGIAYGMFDAWVVVWQRQRISNFVYATAGRVLRVRKAPLKTH